MIEANLHETPKYGGWVESKGPRYCPSIEDKVVRFKDKPSHQVGLLHGVARQHPTAACNAYHYVCHSLQRGIAKEQATVWLWLSVLSSSPPYLWTQVYPSRTALP